MGSRDECALYDTEPAVREEGGGFAAGQVSGERQALLYGVLPPKHCEAGLSQDLHLADKAEAAQGEGTHQFPQTGRGRTGL